jgi:peroxiredoxin Q/BCP
MVEVGKKAPAFRLRDQDGSWRDLNGFSEKYLVVYFYPKDMTAGCTLEAKGFSDKMKEYDKAGARVVGISGGSTESKKKFCEKNDLTITLLADEDLSVAKKYGVYGEKKFMGRSFMGINRTTFVLDRDRKVLKVYEKVKPVGHAEEVLDFIRKQD